MPYKLLQGIGVLIEFKISNLQRASHIKTCYCQNTINAFKGYLFDYAIERVLAGTHLLLYFDDKHAARRTAYRKYVYFILAI